MEFILTLAGITSGMSSAQHAGCDDVSIGRLASSTGDNANFSPLEIGSQRSLPLGVSPAVDESAGTSSHITTASSERDRANVGSSKIGSHTEDSNVIVELGWAVVLWMAVNLIGLEESTSGQAVGATTTEGHLASRGTGDTVGSSQSPASSNHRSTTDMATIAPHRQGIGEVSDVGILATDDESIDVTVILGVGGCSQTRNRKNTKHLAPESLLRK